MLIKKCSPYSITERRVPDLIPVFGSQPAGDTHTRLMALFPGLPGWAGTRKAKLIWIYCSNRRWVAVASAGPYASLQLLQTDNHASTPPLSLQVTWVINLAVGCHYFLPGLQLPPQPFCWLVNRDTMDVNSLPKIVTQQRRGCDLNPGPSVPEYSTLITRLPSHPWCWLATHIPPDVV